MDSTLAAETQNFLVPNATIFVVSLIFMVILWFFYRFVVPPLTKAMAERDEMNRRQAEERDAAVRRLAEAQERYDAALADARAQATAVKDEARADAQRIRDEMRAETDRKVAAIRERGARRARRTAGRGPCRSCAGRSAACPPSWRAGSSAVRSARTTRTSVSYLAELDERQTAGGQR
jgi:F0F1-type ATP synthase membrane subunit b/b'